MATRIKLWPGVSALKRKKAVQRRADQVKIKSSNQPVRQSS